MGCDAGFDMVPPLSASDLDQTAWEIFIEEIRLEFRYDHCVVDRKNYIEFEVGEHPMLPYHGHKCLRFSSKITGTRGSAAEPYLDAVKAIARKHFGSRVRYWNELFDVYGHHDWRSVNASLRTYVILSRHRNDSNVSADSCLEPGRPPL